MTFNYYGTVEQNLTSNLETAKQAIRDVELGNNSDGGTNIQAGLYKARTVLKNAKSENGIIILLSDGGATGSYKLNNERNNGYLVTAVGGIYAWSKLSASVTNNIKTPTVDTEVVEKFDKDSTVDWFDQVEKEVQFKNTGTAPVFLRVSYAEFWKDADGKVISGLVDGNEVVNKNWTEAWQNDWFDGGDGWYYYKKVLPANEMTAKVLTSLKFDSNYAEIYQTADYTLKFVSEAVQYSDDDSVNHRAVQANFGRDFKVISNNVITWN